MAANASRLPEFPIDAIDGRSCVDALAARHCALTSSARSAIDTAAESGDAATADLFTEVVRGLDKALWFLESHLRAGSASSAKHKDLALA
jgi:starvation-inducible DNA-binding protein